VSGKALDLGCGSGVQSLVLADHGLEVVGVDLSETAVAQAKQRASQYSAERPPRFITGDLTELRNIGEPFDLLFDRGCYHQARRENLDGFVRALRDLSHSGSTLFVMAFSSTEPPEFPGLPVVSEEDLRAELGGLFDVTDLRTCRLDRPRDFTRSPLFWSVLLKRR
jgi:cyclopropane fatty-acyl-phospholipid synthase-like methyltransferase